jgi:hypothetical protein
MGPSCSNGCCKLEFVQFFDDYLPTSACYFVFHFHLKGEIVITIRLLIAHVTSLVTNLYLPVENMQSVVAHCFMLYLLSFSAYSYVYSLCLEHLIKVCIGAQENIMCILNISK